MREAHWNMARSPLFTNAFNFKSVKTAANSDESELRASKSYEYSLPHFADNEDCSDGVYRSPEI